MTTVADTSAETDLGKILIDDFRKAKPLGIGLIAGGVALAGACMAGFTAPAMKSNPAPLACFTFVGLGMVALGVLILVKGDVHTRLGEKGVEATTKAGTKRILFSNMAAFRCFIAEGKAAQIGFKFITTGTQEDDACNFGWTAMRGPKMEQADVYREFLTKVFAERMLADLKAGTPAAWGSGRITPRAIELGGKSITWKEITRVTIRNSGKAVITSSKQGDVSLQIDEPNFWPGFAILKRQLDPSTFV